MRHTGLVQPLRRRARPVRELVFAYEAVSPLLKRKTTLRVPPMEAPRRVSGTQEPGDVGYLMRFSSKRTVLAEIERCEPVCANCHAVRTFERRHGA